MPEQRIPAWKRVLRFRFLFAVNAAALVILGASFGREWVRNREIEGEIARLEAEARSLEARNLEITDLNAAFRTESFIEREARLKLGMKKPGESVVVIREEESAPAELPADGDASAPASDDPRLLLVGSKPAESTPNPSRWWRYFFQN